MSTNITRAVDSRVACACFFFVLLFGIHALAQTQDEVAYVLNLKGKWILNSSAHPLKPGSSLSEGTIKLQEQVGGDFIEIADRGGRLLKTLKCDREDCSAPIKIHAVKDSAFSRLVYGIMRILGRDDRKYAVAISRGGELREAVVAIADGQVDLTSIFAGKSRGPYLVRFVPKGISAKPQAPVIGPVRIDWNPGKLCIVSVKGLNPGLYEVQLLSNEDREPLEPGTEAWTLFVKPENFGSKFCEFREAQLLTESWGESIRQSTKRQFLRAALAKLETE